jgi:hypothetical protein
MRRFPGFLNVLVHSFSVLGLLVVLALSAFLLTPNEARANPPAGWQTVALADYPLGQATDTRISSLGLGLFTVCWRDPNGQVCTRTRGSAGLGPVVVHGVGTNPVVFDQGFEFFLAYSSGSQVVVRHGSPDGAWDPPVVLDTGFNSPTHDPDFCNAGDPPGLRLTWGEGGRVMFTSWQAGTWATPEIAAADAVSGIYPGQQVEPSGPTGQPRIYYHDTSYSVVYRERTTPGTWTAPTAWPASDPDTFWPFRVAGNFGFAGLNAMIHTGIPPTCPCNRVYFARETAPGTWAPPQEITVHLAAKDFPKYVSLWIDEFGYAECFWYQAAFDEGLNLVGEKMFYRVFTPDGSSFEPWTFDTQVGTYNDLDWGECSDCGMGPDFCWIETLPGGGTRIVALRSTSIGGVAGDPRLEAGLKVVPNPASGTSSITWAPVTPGPARVEIFDAAGRLVRNFGAQETGASRVAWNGETAAGVAAPSGSYLVRLVTTRGSASRTVIRIR